MRPSTVIVLCRTLAELGSIEYTSQAGGWLDERGV